MHATPRLRRTATPPPPACGLLRAGTGTPRSLRAGALAALAALALLAIAGRAFAATITVTSTDDTVAAGDGKVTLREAIAAVDAGNDLGDADIAAQHPGAFGNADTIAFGIAGSGVHTIRPGSPLPAIVKDVTIDGFTQPGASANTIASGPASDASHVLAGGSDAVLLIELDGSAAGADADGLGVGAGTSAVALRGLIVNRFGGAGIKLGGNVEAALEGDYIGTDAGGTTALGNGVGVEASADGYVYARIGGDGPASLTLVSGNAGAGVLVQGAMASGLKPKLTCRYAYVGTDAGGTHALGNGGNGIELRGDAEAAVGTCLVAANGGNGVDVGDTANAQLSGYLWVGVGVGGSALGNIGHGLRFAGSSWGDPGYRDAIQYNGGAGIRVEDDALVYASPLSNVIADNGTLAIDTGGASLAQNAPVVETATSNAADGTTFAGSIDTAANTQVEIMLAFDSQCDADHRGQSRLFPSFPTSTTVVATTDADGHADWTWHADAALDVSTFAYVSAVAVPTAMPPGAHVSPVSEFSPCIAIVGSGTPTPGTLQFAAAGYNVAENAGSVDVVVTRSGGSSGAASATLATADGGALAGSDYTAVSATLNWADGDAAPKHVAIPILDDAVAEGEEQFTVLLSAASGATLGTPATATITIVDDDSPVPVATVTTLTAAPNTAPVGQAIAFTATVAAAAPVRTAGNAVPGGSVTFREGAATLATVALDGDGVAHYATNALGAGAHTITAAYSGDAGFAASNASTGVTVTAGAPVTGAVPTPTLSPWSAIGFGGLLVLVTGFALRRRSRADRNATMR